MIFLLGVATGYRLQDIVSLTIYDLKEAIEKGYFEVQEKKQYKAWVTHTKKYPKSTRKKPDKRRHDIVPSLEAYIKNYIEDKKKSEYAFPSQKGRGCKYITEKSYSDILKKVSLDSEINLESITGHSLRKTYANRLYESTHDLEYVRIALGHKSVEVTKKYLGIEDKVKESAAKIAGSRL